MPAARGGGMRLDAGIFGEGGAGLLGLGQAELAGRDEVEAERRQQLLEFGELAGVVGGQHQPVAAARSGQLGSRHGGERRLLQRGQFGDALLGELPSGFRARRAQNGTCSAVPWISTNLPPPVRTKLASVCGLDVLEIVEIEHRGAAIDAAGDGGDRVAQRLALGRDRAPCSQRDGVGQRDVGAGDRGGAGAAIGLDARRNRG